MRDDPAAARRRAGQAAPCAQDADLPEKEDPEDDEDVSLGIELPRYKTLPPGASAGIEHYQLSELPSAEGKCVVTCIDYSPSQFLRQEVTNMAEFISGHRPEWATVRWISVVGLEDMAIIRALAEKYELHPLAIEDMLCIPQRPKAEFYPGEPGMRARHFIVARLIQLDGGKLHSEQVSIFLGHRTILTFQQDHGDVWESIRQRIAQAGSRLRSYDPSFLVHSLFDTMVDQCFPILEHYGDELEDLEDRVVDGRDSEAIHDIHKIKRELLLLRRAIWPMRTVVQTLQREQNECLSDPTRTYFRDVADNLAQIVDLVETYREVAMGIAETHLSAMSNNLNAVMKVLTIIGTIFIPLTFLAGVYGMNMPIPENHYHITYPVFWGVCLAISGGMLLWFKHRNWI